MRGESAHRTAAGTAADGALFDYADGCAHFDARPSDGEAKNAAAPYLDIHTGHSLSVSFIAKLFPDRVVKFNQYNADRPDWLEGSIPVSARYGDIYFSADDPLGETRHVFLAGNGLPGRFRPGFHVAELGFGTGLNMLAVLAEWCASGIEGRLTYTGFEAHPLRVKDIERALSPFTELSFHLHPVLSALREGQSVIQTPSLQAELVPGDARTTLPLWDGRADAWFLDGFSPSCNPELWEDDLLAKLPERTAPNGTFATYTAAGRVRRALMAVGFSVERTAGFGRKRHMLRGRLNAESRSK